MGTRGVYGIRKGGVDKLMYNHFDSYPTSLGVTVMNFVKGKTDVEMSAQHDFMEEIDSDTPPTKAEWDLCLKAITVNLGVGSQKEEDWYCVLRELQGNLDKQSPPNGIPYFINGNNFVKDSLFCEWGYIVNVDTGKLEIYRGFNKINGGKGRYAKLLDENGEKKKDMSYYGIVLLAEVPFEDIRKWSDSEIEKANSGIESANNEKEEGEGREEVEEFIKGYLS